MYKVYTYQILSTMLLNGTYTALMELVIFLKNEFLTFLYQNFYAYSPRLELSYCSKWTWSIMYEVLCMHTSHRLRGVVVELEILAGHDHTHVIMKTPSSWIITNTPKLVAPHIIHANGYHNTSVLFDGGGGLRNVVYSFSRKTLITP